jgi:hypothetical protein
VAKIDKIKPIHIQISDLVVVRLRNDAINGVAIINKINMRMEILPRICTIRIYRSFASPGALSALHFEKYLMRTVDRTDVGTPKIYRSEMRDDNSPYPAGPKILPASK